MFVRKKSNFSGSYSIQAIQKIRGKNKVVKIIGCATTQCSIENLIDLARQEIERVSLQ